MVTQDLLPLLRAHALRTKSGQVDLRQFVASLPKGQAQPGEVETLAADLIEKDVLVAGASEGGKPRIVSFPDFPAMALAEEYRQLTVEPTRPFPTEETAPVRIPAEALINAEVKAQLGNLIEASGPDKKGIIKLRFPEGVDSCIVPLESVGTDLIEAAVAKISHYLQNGKNAAYAESRIGGVLKGSELSVRQSIEEIAQLPKKSAAAVRDPSEFTFKFWTHLSNLVLQDVKSKSEKTTQDQGLCQSVYIIGYTVFHRKGTVQREKDLSEDRKRLETQVRKAPFVFGYQDFYQMKDAKGALLATKHGKDFLNAFLTEKTKRAGDEPLPYLVRVHAEAQDKDYFLHRDVVLPVFIKKLAECREELRKLILDEWTAAMRKDVIPETSRADAAFRKDVDTRVKQGYPLLTALSNGSMLFLAGEQPSASAQAKAELQKCFALENILRPYDELLGLSRAELLQSVRMYLPFWLTMPILSSFLRLFRRKPSQKKGKAKTAAGEEQARAAGEEADQAGADKAKVKAERDGMIRYNNSVRSLISVYVPRGATIDGTLAELAEKWNPLLDPAQKKDLVEDVNALTRDFLRPIRRSFVVRPPDQARIHSLAQQLSNSKNLAQIKKTDVLIRYIELYMIRCLQVKQI
jgi:hypothetical protein